MGYALLDVLLEVIMIVALLKAIAGEKGRGAIALVDFWEKKVF